ncbi:unnamed protein product [Nesidiocoris tenuis]|uniref:CCR4-NOT transcription complex subunit 1 TTP binding domain-containing protein n=1 Tax=Nesidiocoris tenuis TaxID=355587 RepID=A0A6H5GPI6_9HEMI|nr:unnamed protein product [Nesidiocoris tenuis]
MVRDRHGLYLVIQTIRLGLFGKQYYGELRFPVDILYRPWKHTEAQRLKSSIAESFPQEVDRTHRAGDASRRKRPLPRSARLDQSPHPALPRRLDAGSSPAAAHGVGRFQAGGARESYADVFRQSSQFGHHTAHGLARAETRTTSGRLGQRGDDPKGRSTTARNSEHHLALSSVLPRVRTFWIFSLCHTSTEMSDFDLRNFRFRNVSSGIAEAIHQVIGACGVVKTRQPQPPPGVLRPQRGLDAFPPNSVFTSQVDTLGSGIAGISLATTSAFTIPAALGQLVSNPGSPSRLMAASQSPAYSMMPLGAPGPSLVPQVGVGVPAAMARLQPLPQPQQQQPIEKNRLSNDSANLFRGMSFPVAKDIEDEANSYFQRIYNHPPHPTISIDEVLDMLKKFMDSPKQRERDVFYCMLRNLFEEYKFFPQYPDKELFITAQLFGGIIERGLVSDYRELGMALRFVLDALRKVPESKMFYFGIAALDRFKSRLKDYHKYCEHIASIPHFSQFPTHLIEYIDYGLQSEEPPNRPQGPILPGGLPTVTTTYKTTAPTTATTTTTVTVAKVTPSSVIPSRVSEFDAQNPKKNPFDYTKMVYSYTVLLRSDKGIANFSDRSLLKNLGHWLGMLTLGRNRPILSEELDMKSLLVEAYNKGQQELLYVVPFVAKVLESCAKSRQDLNPKVYLKDPENLKNLDHQLSPPKLKPEVQIPTPIPTSHTPTQALSHVPDEVSQRSNSTPTLAPVNPPEPRYAYAQINISSTASIAQHIVINSQPRFSQLALFQAHPLLKQCVRQAIESAINDWIHPVVDRAVKIAATTSEQVVKKEYERRKIARNDGRRYCDSAVLTYQAERMPEQLRLKVGGVTAQQAAVYEDLARNIPGFQPLTDRDAAQYLPKQVTVESLLELVSTAADSDVALRHKELYLRVLKTLQDPRAYGLQWTNKQITR